MSALDIAAAALALLWLAFELRLSATKRPEPGTEARDRFSFPLVFGSKFVSINVAFILGLNVAATRQAGALPGLAVPLGVLGCGLILAGMALRHAAVRALGRRFTVQVAIVGEHAIVRDGLYRWVRHPAYLGSLASILGVGLALHNWISLAVILPLPLAATLYRIRVEEAVLRGHFGAAYEDYARTTARLVPGIY